MDKDLTEKLSNEFASRSRSWDWDGLFGCLPDPDPILEKLGESVHVYRSLMSDAHVWACMTSRIYGVLAREWKLKLPGNTKNKPASEKALQAFKEDLTALPMQNIITDILMAPLYGISPCEITWEKGKRWKPGSIQGKPAEWFAYSFENEPRFLSMSHVLEGEPLPDMKFLMPRHFPTYKNPYGERTLSRCFWPVAFKRGGFKFWAVFAEKFGMPWPVGKVPGSTSDTQRLDLLTRLRQMVQDAVAVINDDQSIEMHESGSKTGSADIYERLITASNREISKAILGQTLTTEVGSSGSYAASKSHMDVRQEIIDADKKMTEEQFNILSRWYCKLNFPEAEPPVFYFYESEDLQLERSERDEKLSNQGVKFQQQYYERAYGFEKGDIEVPAAPEEKSDFLKKSDFFESAGADDEIGAIMELAAQAGQTIIEKQVKSAFKALDSLSLSSAFQEKLARAKFFCGLAGAADEIEEQ